MAKEDRPNAPAASSLIASQLNFAEVQVQLERINQETAKTWERMAEAVRASGLLDGGVSTTEVPSAELRKEPALPEAEALDLPATPATAIPLDKLLPELLNRPDESGPAMAEPERSDQHFDEWLRRPTMRLSEVAAVLGVSEKHVYRIPGLRRVRKGTFNTDSVKRVLAGKKK